MQGRADVISLWLCGKFARKCSYRRAVPVYIESDRGCHVVCALYGCTPEHALTGRAFDLEKRQHLFANGIIKPLERHQVGFYGSGIITDVGVDIQKAEDEIDAKWSAKGQKAGDDSAIFELKGQGIGSGQPGREKLL